MLEYFTLILVCQLLGELAVSALALPLPGPVVGMLLLFCLLLVRGFVPTELGKVSDALLNSLSLLFVPAGVGVMLHFELLGTELVPLSVALVVSTLTTIAVTALVMTWFSKGEPSGNADGNEGGTASEARTSGRSAP